MLVYPIFFIYKIIYFNVVVFVVVLFSVFSVFGVFSVFSVFSVFCCIKLTTEFSPSEFSWVFYLSVTTVCYVILEVCSIVLIDWLILSFTFIHSFIHSFIHTLAEQFFLLCLLREQVSLQYKYVKSWHCGGHLDELKMFRLSQAK